MKARPSDSLKVMIGLDDGPGLSKWIAQCFVLGRRVALERPPGARFCWLLPKVVSKVPVLY